MEKSPSLEANRS